MVDISAWLNGMAKRNPYTTPRAPIQNPYKPIPGGALAAGHGKGDTPPPIPGRQAPTWQEQAASFGGQPQEQPYMDDMGGATEMWRKGYEARNPRPAAPPAGGIGMGMGKEQLQALMQMLSQMFKR